MPNASMVRATAPRSLPCEASTEAAPKVGPTQGDHTAPSSSPTANCPPSPAVEKPPKRCSVQFPTGPAASANCACNRGARSTTPTAISRMPATMRNTPASSPIAKPTVATVSPITTNDSASPPARANGPARCSLSALPSTIGNSGSTQGDSVERTPARNASAVVAMRAPRMPARP